MGATVDRLHLHTLRQPLHKDLQAQRVLRIKQRDQVREFLSGDRQPCGLHERVSLQLVVLVHHR